MNQHYKEWLIDNLQPLQEWYAMTKLRRRLRTGEAEQYCENNSNDFHEFCTHEYFDTQAGRITNATKVLA